MATGPTRITATDKTPLIIIATVLLLCLSLCAVVMRLVVKLSRSVKSCTPDDYLLASSLVFSIVQSVVVTAVRARHGFGKPANQLSSYDLDKSLQAELIANILYVCSLTTAKVSILAMIVYISPLRAHRRASYAVGAIIFSWAVTSIFVVSLECGGPRTWDYVNGSRCINRGSWWTVFNVFNIITEILLIAMPVWLIYAVRLTTLDKVFFLLPFCGRFCTIAACITDIWIWLDVVQPAPDPFFIEWQSSICVQVIQCSCLTSSCAMFLKRFLAMLGTGFALEGDLSISVPVELRTYSTSSESREMLTPHVPIYDFGTLAEESKMRHESRRNSRRPSEKYCS